MIAAVRRRPSPPGSPEQRPATVPGAVTAPVRVSHPEDPAERAAERMANAVVRVLPAPDHGAATSGTTSTGRLDDATRRRFEPHFGDLSAVRVHTDAVADRESRRLGALAFTRGSDVSFATGSFSPRSAAGQRLLAHELAHLTDPGRRPDVVHRDLAGYTRDHLEVEQSFTGDPGTGSAVFDVTSADAAALSAALAGLTAAGKVGTATRGDLQRFWSEGATLAEVEAAFTAAAFPRAHDMAFSLLDGTRIAVYSRHEKRYIPGLIWDTTLWTSSQNVAVQTTRGLTHAERTAARSVYGSSLAYDSIVLDESFVMSVGCYARTTPWTINLPPGTLSGGMSVPWLIHELGHSWEYAQGVSLATTFYHAVRGVYAYGGEAELARRTAAGKGLASFNTEQQADIAKDAYLAIHGTGTLAVYQPYIDEFHHGYR